MVLAFGAAILLGSLLLMAPWASTGAPLGFCDALFTATSATCVTGLAVVDTGSQLSGLGQGVVLVLIQLGGLGIMTYSSLVLLVVGRSLSFRGEALLYDTLGERELISPKTLVRSVFLFTVAAELAGALILTLVMSRKLPLPAALYHGVFHSISAFCNAGFSLNADSLVAYRGDWVVNFTVMTLILLGGLGFVVLWDVAHRCGSRPKRRLRLRLHTKVVLTYSAGLTLVGAAGLLVFEARNSLAGLPWTERIVASLFQSITPRTAGFNTLDYGGFRDATLFLTVILMFIGASPGSCGGGIKTTSLAVVVSLFWNRVRGNTNVTMYRRTVPEDVVSRAIAILVVSFVLASAMAFFLLLSEVVPRPHRGEEAVFLDILFETVSAYGTVGLSTGITGQLSAVGKTILIATMFAGRLGPLTLAMAVGSRKGRGVRYAEEGLMVG